MIHEHNANMSGDEKGGGVQSGPKFIFEFLGLGMLMILSCYTGSVSAARWTTGAHVTQPSIGKGE